MTSNGDRDRQLQVLGDVLRALGDEFVRGPFMFLYEEDMRARLYSAMVAKLGMGYAVGAKHVEVINKQHRGSGSVFNEFGCETTVSPVQAEYPQLATTENGNRKWRFDVCIVNRRADPTHASIWDLPVSVALEVKLGCEQVGSDKFGDFAQDFKKLQDYATEGRSICTVPSFLGVAVYFYQGVDPENDKMNTWLKKSGIPDSRKVPLESLSLMDNRLYAIVIPAACVPRGDIYLYEQTV